MAQDKSVAWVEVVPPSAATGDLARAYAAVQDAQGTVENLYLAMSQTPLAIPAAEDHYRAVLHNPDNPLPPWLSELVGTYVAILCGCDYAAQNHGANFAMYLKDPPRAQAILAALRDGTAPPGDALQDAALAYTRKMTLDPAVLGQQDIETLRAAGLCDKGISYLIQIAASFAYWSRMINGLGTVLGDKVGLSPGQGT